VTSDLDHYRPPDQPPGIVGLGVRYRELGRLRMGQRVDTGREKNGRKVYRPEKLDRWRFTSTDWRLIARAAELYGGEPSRWEEAPGWNTEKQSGVRQYQVTTEENDVPVMLPPEVALSQSMEAWKAAECLRRCDGTWDQISGAECLCSQEETPLCKPTTRLSVLLTDMPGLGVWRLETHGWYAARELVPMVRLASSFGAGQRFRLRIDPRQRQTKDDHGKTVTYVFGVPVLDTDMTPGQLLAATPTPGPVAEVAAMVNQQVEQTSEVGERKGGSLGGGSLRHDPASDDQSDPPVRLAPPAAGGSDANLPATEGGEDDVTPADGEGPAVRGEPPGSAVLASVDGTSEGVSGNAEDATAGPTPPIEQTSVVIAWCTAHGINFGTARLYLAHSHKADFGKGSPLPLRTINDMAALAGDAAQRAVAYLNAQFTGSGEGG
jgi:hypothetical protein